MLVPDQAIGMQSATTRGMSAERSQELWQRLAGAYQCEMTCVFPPGRPFIGTATRLHTGSHELVTWTAPDIGYRRSARHVRLDPIEAYRLVLPFVGTAAIRYDDQEIRVRPRSGYLMNMNQPFAFRHTAGTPLMLLAVPRREIDRRLNGRVQRGLSLDLARGLGRVVDTVVTSLVEERSHLTAAQFDAVTERALELLGELLDGAPKDAASGGRLSEVEAAVRRHVRDHIEAPDLGVDSVATALGWSVRQIQLALRRAGTTPSELIRCERLALARTRLTSPHYRYVSITEIAHRCGFGSASTFSTAFRQRYGISPRQIRVGTTGTDDHA